MSSQLSLFNAVPTGAIEVFHDNNRQIWFKRADLGRHLKVADIRHNFKDLKDATRTEISGGGPTPSRSIMHGGDKNPRDKFVDLDPALETAVRSKKPKPVELVRWLVKKGVEKTQEEHQQAIEESDSILALLNDDLEERDRQIVVLEKHHLELQNRVKTIERRAVPHLEDAKKDNGVIIIQKNNGDEYPYITICGQQGYVAQKIQNK